MTQLLPGQFLIASEGELGEGGFGRVDKVRVTQSTCTHPVGSVWARKRLNPKWDQHPEMRERFEREIAALRRLNHPNIVSFEGENLPGNERYYLMPFFESSLRRLISAQTWMGNWREIARASAQLASALEYAHQQNAVHRDIKPENILFNPGHPLVITDWGIGYFVHEHSKVLQHLTRGGMGTEYYCSLEQWATGKCDGRGDIYALGMTLDEWATGRQRSIKVGFGIGSVGPFSSGGVGAERFNRLLVQMTQPLTQNRPVTMGRVAAELNAIGAH